MLGPPGTPKSALVLDQQRKMASFEGRQKRGGKSPLLVANSGDSASAKQTMLGGG